MVCLVEKFFLLKVGLSVFKYFRSWIQGLKGEPCEAVIYLSFAKI
jgi:hypothetical protein